MSEIIYVISCFLIVVEYICPNSDYSKIIFLMLLIIFLKIRKIQKHFTESKDEIKEE